MGFVKVAKADEMKDGEAKPVEVEGKKIALYRVDGKFYATTNTCIHKGGPLGEGELDEKVVTCPWHGWKFDVETGVSPVNPQARVDVFEVKVEGGDVLVNVE